MRGLHLHLLTGADDPHHGVWNDRLIQQHPGGAAPDSSVSIRVDPWLKFRLLSQSESLA